jgi:hypothetical protein
MATLSDEGMRAISFMILVERKMREAYNYFMEWVEF